MPALCVASIGQGGDVQDKICAWLERHILSISPFRWSSASEALFRRKVTAEAALYLMILKRFGCEIASDRHKILRAHLIGMAPAILDLAARSPERAALMAIPIAFALSEDGLSARDVARAIDIYTSDYVWGFERPLHRMLELCLPCAVVGVQPRYSVESLLAASCLEVRPCILTAPRDAFYALTHSAMYAGLLTRSVPPTSLQQDLDEILAWALADYDLDLASELAVSRRLLGITQSVNDLDLDSRIRCQVLEAGVVTARNGSAADRFSRERPEEAHFARHYHTMMMAGLVLVGSQARPALGLCAQDAHNDNLWVEICRAARGYDLAETVRLGSAFADHATDSVYYSTRKKRLAEFFRRAWRDGHRIGHYQDEEQAAAIAGQQPPRSVAPSSAVSEMVNASESMYGSTVY